MMHLCNTGYLEADAELQDHYDRYLFYIWLEDGSLFNLVLLEAGLAKVTTYPPNVEYVDFYIKAQESALENGLGLRAESAFD